MERNLSTEWALEQSASAAKTETGIQKATDLAHRAVVEKERKTIRKIPVYARHRLTQTDEVKKIYEKFAGSTDIPEYIEKAIAQLAFHIQLADSRLQKRYRGENMKEAGIRTEDNGKYGWDGAACHYADYSATISPDGRHMWVDYGRGFREYLITASGACVIGGRHIRKPEVETYPVLKPRHLRRLYERAIRGNNVVVWEWNTKEEAGEYIHTATGESYHTPAHTTEPKKVFREAVHAFRLRRDEKKRKEAELKALEKVYVTANDSISAGNCRVRTEEFNDELDRKYGVHIFAISATALLVMRDDAYTRRAVRYAAQK